MSLLTALIFSFAIGFSGAHAAPTAPVQAVQVVQAVEVDPILAMDAKTTLDDYSVEAHAGTIIDYVETLDSKPAVNELYTFTLESIDFPGHFHKYAVKLIYSA